MRYHLCNTALVAVLLATASGVCAQPLEEPSSAIEARAVGHASTAGASGGLWSRVGGTLGFKGEGTKGVPEQPQPDQSKDMGKDAKKKVQGGAVKKEGAGGGGSGQDKPASVPHKDDSDAASIKTFVTALGSPSSDGGPVEPKGSNSGPHNGGGEPSGAGAEPKPEVDKGKGKQKEGEHPPADKNKPLPPIPGSPSKEPPSGAADGNHNKQVDDAQSQKSQDSGGGFGTDDSEETSDTRGNDPNRVLDMDAHRQKPEGEVKGKGKEESRAEKFTREHANTIIVGSSIAAIAPAVTYGFNKMANREAAEEEQKAKEKEAAAAAAPEGSPPPEQNPQADGTQPPADGTQPPADGAQPPADGAQPPADGAQPPADGAQSPADGAQPPAADSQPPAADAQPPAADAQPPAAGANPPESQPARKRSVVPLRVARAFQA